MSTLNIDLLQKVKAAILAEPEHFDMSWWTQENDCGTAGCIAGWAVALAGGKSLGLVHARRLAGHIAQEARDSLQISQEESNKLFLGEYWPEPFRSRYTDAKSKRWASIAADRIDHFIATGE